MLVKDGKSVTHSSRAPCRNAISRARALLISDAFNSSTIVKSSKYLEFQSVARLIPPVLGSHQVCAAAIFFIRRNTSLVSMDGVHYYFNQGRPRLSGNYFIANTASRSFEKIVELMVIERINRFSRLYFEYFLRYPDG